MTSLDTVLLMRFVPCRPHPEETLAANEHWLVMSGAIELTLDDRSIRLAPEDIALLRVGIRRQLTACSDARVIVARERTIDVPRSDS